MLKMVASDGKFIDRKFKAAWGGPLWRALFLRDLMAMRRRKIREKFWRANVLNGGMEESSA